MEFWKLSIVAFVNSTFDANTVTPSYPLVEQWAHQRGVSVSSPESPTTPRPRTHPHDLTSLIHGILSHDQPSSQCVCLRAVHLQLQPAQTLRINTFPTRLPSQKHWIVLPSRFRRNPLSCSLLEVLRWEGFRNKLRNR